MRICKIVLDGEVFDLASLSYDELDEYLKRVQAGGLPGAAAATMEVVALSLDKADTFLRSHGRKSVHGEWWDARRVSRELTLPTINALHDEIVKISGLKAQGDTKQNVANAT